MTKDEIIKAAADKLMGWKLPNDFCPDCYISFDREKASTQVGGSWPIGTNLFHHQQAQDMFKHCLGDAIEALVRDAELRYTSFRNPHNDDQWLEHPADSEIIDPFDDAIEIGFEYDIVAGSYTTQRYRVTKVPDDVSDDTEVELVQVIAAQGEKNAND
jgi:hypothetical protein